MPNDEHDPRHQARRPPRRFAELLKTSRPLWNPGPVGKVFGVHDQVRRGLLHTGQCQMLPAAAFSKYRRRRGVPHLNDRQVHCASRQSRSPYISTREWRVPPLRDRATKGPCRPWKIPGNAPGLTQGQGQTAASSSKCTLDEKVPCVRSCRRSDVRLVQPPVAAVAVVPSTLQ